MGLEPRTRHEVSALPFLVDLVCELKLRVSVNHSWVAKLHFQLVVVEEKDEDVTAADVAVIHVVVPLSLAIVLLQTYNESVLPDLEAKLANMATQHRMQGY